MRKAFVFLLFVLFPILSYADVQENDLNAIKNMEKLESKIKDNELQFSLLTEEARKRYKNFDWTGFDDLSENMKRTVIRNYLAQEAFSEIREDYKKDIYARSDGKVSIENHGNDTYYYNSDDELYRTDYVEDNIMKEAEKQNLLHPTEGTNWFHFKQRDLPALDKIIAAEIAKSPADMYCDKECIHPRSSVDQDFTQKYLAVWKKRIDKYEKEMNEIINNEENSLREYQEWYSNFEKEYSKYEGTEDIIKKDKEEIEKDWRDLEIMKQDFAKEMMKSRKEYDEYAKRSKEIDVWELKPYRSDCEMVTISCWNVEPIPEQYERYRLSVTKEDKDTHSSIFYSYDDMNKNEHVESMAIKSCDCHNGATDVGKYVDCSCLISFGDVISDFDKYRKFENLDRIDVKNGKHQDRDEKGRFLHDWPGNYIPVGRIRNSSTHISGSHHRNEN